MCGITGIWHLDHSILYPGKLEAFTDSLAHRGPDGRGFYIDEEACLGLGHRRLSILDLSDHASQPMHSVDSDLVICYNGEIFNFIELKKELERSGFSFRTSSDTEILLAAYQKWGKQCLLKLNGMWAFAIWNKRKKELFLARDRFGIKPLYYLNLQNDIFAFASETHAFKFLDKFSRKISGDLMARTLDNPVWSEGSGYTLFEDIVELLPGHYLELRADEPARQKRWWNTMEHLPEVPFSYEKQVDELRELFENACRIRMRSDVTIASALSGGMDSSSVYCMIHHLMKQDGDKERIASDWQRAFVATFPGTSVDERAYAEEVIRFTKGQGVFIEQNFPELPGRIIETTRLFDSITPTPIIAVSDVYKSMKEAGIKVSLDGHGVDEMLYGYTGLVSSVYTQALLNDDPAFAADILNTYIMLHPVEEGKKAGEALVLNGKKKANAFTADSLSNIEKKIKETIKSVIRKKTLHASLQTGEWLNRFECKARPQLSNAPYNLGKLDYSELLLFEEFHLTTLPLNLRDFDRASMMNGIEIRMPFMDWRLVAFIFALPLQSKIGQGYTKKVLRDAMKGIIPESIRTRTLKIGLSAPTSAWFKGPLKEMVRDILSSRSFLESPYWNGKEINKFSEETFRSDGWNKINAQQVWTFINAHLIIN